MVDQELIRKFFQNRCNAQEAEKVLHYFKQHPEQLETWLPEEEWNKLEDPADWEQGLTERMLTNIRQQAYKKPSGRRLNFLVLTTVAASLLICLLALANFLTSGITSKPEALTEKAIAASAVKETSIKKNTSDTLQQILLEDGSTVKLSPGSSIRYGKGFTTSRLIHLTGEAFFEIAKDTLHPFAVIAGGISTTALGTSFTIQATGEQKAIKVRLHTGRVEIKPVSKELEDAFPVLYLKPGQEMSLNVALKKAHIADFATSNASKKAGSIQARGNILEVDQLPLQQLLNELTKIYKLPISYTEADISGIQFTGKLQLNRPLNSTLQTIAAVNGLKITKRKNGYDIHKP